MISSNFKLSILTKPRIVKRFIVICMDLILSLVAVWIAFYLRIGEFLPVWKQRDEHYLLPACIVAFLISNLIFNYFNLYKVIFRYLGTLEMMNIVKACIVYGIIYSVIFTLIQVDGVPRTIGIIQPLIFFLLVSFSRFFAAYYLRDIYDKKSIKDKKKQVVIYGAGNRGYQLSRSLSPNSKINIVGFFDDDISLHGNKINNLDILNPKEIDKLITSKNISEIILAFDKENTNYFKKIMDQFKDKNLALRILPSYEDIYENYGNLNNIRDLSINDILGRDPVSPNYNLMKKDILNKVVLVSGAGGSIGSQLSIEILKQKPNKLILLDHSEFALFKISQNLKRICVNDHIDIIPILGSVTDINALDRLFSNFKPNTIFHAAAYKHVNIVEENIIEGINNNIFGTLNLANMAINNYVRKFVLISTDKAVRPTSIMGATKRIAEMILQALSKTQKKTLFSIVRFGNVLDSSGSVVPLFRSQIKMGGPVTVTHKDVTRYFMTIQEAAQLVIQAGAMTDKVIKKSITAPIFLLEMGQPIKIFNLAKLMIELAGSSVYNYKKGTGDIEIKITGLRPGEKLHEELLIGNTSIESTHPKIRHANETFIEWPKIKNSLLTIEKLIFTKDKVNIKKLIFDISSENIID